MSRDSNWVLPIGAFIAAQYAVLALVGRRVGFSDFPPIFSYSVTALTLACAGGLAIFLHRLWRMWREGAASPISRIANSDWRAMATYLLGFELVALHICAMTWAKEMIPLVTTYWADPYLAAGDRALLETDAWRLVPEAAIGTLQALYPTWAVVKFLALFTVLFSSPSSFKTRAMLSYLMTVGILGTFGQYALPSVGPLLYDQFHGGHRFAGLTVRLTEHAPVVRAAAAYLWNAYSEHHMVFGGGISAMPSMHVATTTWAALVIGSTLPRLKPFAIAFWLVILVGSIGLGWHYLSDGVVGTTGAILVWQIMKLSLSDRRRAFGWLSRHRPQPEPIPPFAE